MDEQTVPEESSPSAEPLTKEGLMAVLAEGKIVVVDGRSAHDEAGVDFILSCYDTEPKVEDTEPKVEEAAPTAEEITPPVDQAAPVAEEAAPVAEKAKGK